MLKDAILFLYFELCNDIEVMVDTAAMETGRYLCKKWTLAMHMLYVKWTHGYVQHADSTANKMLPEFYMETISVSLWQIVRCLHIRLAGNHNTYGMLIT